MSSDISMSLVMRLLLFNAKIRMSLCVRSASVWQCDRPLRVAYMRTGAPPLAMEQGEGAMCKDFSPRGSDIRSTAGAVSGAPQEQCLEPVGAVSGACRGSVWSLPECCSVALSVGGHSPCAVPPMSSASNWLTSRSMSSPYFSMDTLPR